MDIIWSMYICRAGRLTSVDSVVAVAPGGEIFLPLSLDSHSCLCCSDMVCVCVILCDSVTCGRGTYVCWWWWLLEMGRAHEICSVVESGCVTITSLKGSRSKEASTRHPSIYILRYWATLAPKDSYNNYLKKRFVVV
jgi:hypothetical protein